MINPEGNDVLAMAVGSIAPCLSAPWWEEVRAYVRPSLNSADPPPTSRPPFPIGTDQVLAAVACCGWQVLYRGFLLPALYLVLPPGGAAVLRYHLPPSTHASALSRPAEELTWPVSDVVMVGCLSCVSGGLPWCVSGGCHHVAVVVSAVIFAAHHMSLSGMIPLATLGFLWVGREVVGGADACIPFLLTYTCSCYSTTHPAMQLTRPYGKCATRHACS